MTNVTAILLAAGFSRRMGDRNKLLMTVRGVPMIRHMVTIYSAVATGPVLVVTGHQAEEIETVLAGSPAKTVHNPDYALGQSTSVTCGLRAAAGGARLLIGLGDQPLLRSQDLRDLLAAQTAVDPSRISIPALDQQRGNPIVVPAVLRARLLSDPASPGCRTFTREHPEHVQFHALTAPGFYADIDTPQDYDRFAATSAARSE